VIFVANVLEVISSSSSVHSTHVAMGASVPSDSPVSPVHRSPHDTQPAACGPKGVVEERSGARGSARGLCEGRDDGFEGEQEGEIGQSHTEGVQSRSRGDTAGYRTPISVVGNEGENETTATNNEVAGDERRSGSLLDWLEKHVENSEHTCVSVTASDTVFVPQVTTNGGSPRSPSGKPDSPLHRASSTPPQPPLLSRGSQCVSPSRAGKAGVNKGAGGGGGGGMEIGKVPNPPGKPTSPTPFTSYPEPRPSASHVIGDGDSISSSRGLCLPKQPACEAGSGYNRGG
ncbi:unnamed protein product, partial [Discosporangium mesarthrocarpum]